MAPSPLPDAVHRGARALVQPPSGHVDLGLGALVACTMGGCLAVGLAAGEEASGTVAALAALNTALVEVPGRWSRRLGAIVFAAVLNALLVGLGTWVAEPAWLGALTTLVVVPLLVLAGLRSPLLRQVAVPSTLLFVVAVGLPEGPVADRALAALAGGGLAVVVLAVALVVGLRPEAPPLPAVRPEVLLPHAVRFGIAAACGVAVAAALSLGHGYWLALTIAVVLRPGLAPTAERVAQRLAGTLLGGLLGALVIELVPSDAVLVAVSAELVGLAAGLMASEYRLAATFITGGVLAMLDIGHAVSVSLVDDRLLATVIGAGIALLAIILWPGPAEEPGPARA